MDSRDVAEALDQHYRQPNLTQKILAALQAAGKDIETLTPDDLTVFDEFHIGGRRTTRALAQLAGPLAGRQVLDVGCGVGGPARTLANEFGCQVIGLDLIGAYCEAATMLSRRVGLSDRVAFCQGSALSLPFPAAAFDLVWLQHVSMNIVDKFALFRDIKRVLRSGGQLALYEVCAGPTEPPHFPLPWAGDSALSFLQPSAALRRQIEAGGFVKKAWQEMTVEALAWFEQMMTRRAAAPASPLGIHLISGSDFAEKGRNVIRNLAEQRITVVRGLFSLR